MKRNKLLIPVVKWVGGKRQLLPELLKYIPDKFTGYYEPFVGGGALLFALQRKSLIYIILAGIAPFLEDHLL